MFGNINPRSSHPMKFKKNPQPNKQTTKQKSNVNFIDCDTKTTDSEIFSAKS